MLLANVIYVPSINLIIVYIKHDVTIYGLNKVINALTPELNTSAQRCLTRFFTGDFAYWTVHFVNIWVKNQQMQQLFIQFTNYVS
jgi:hypothetical protein